MTANLSRRSLLMRGLLGGGAVTVGLPILDVMLNDNGSAFAADMGGGPLPLRFGTWFWGCGMIPARWEPKNPGAGYDLPPQMQPIKAVQQHISVLTGFDVTLDGKPNLPHISGNTAIRTGESFGSWTDIKAPTLDVLIGDAIGGEAYFRSLNMSADGSAKTSYSYRDSASMNAATASAVDFYTEIFGPEFRDPNKADFKPDPRFMVRQSVLSAVTERRQSLLARVGTADRARLDQYFTSVREMENKLAMQLRRPPAAESCVRPPAPAPLPAGIDMTDTPTRRVNHKLMSELLAMALTCNQSRVFNMTFSAAAADLRQTGETTGYHQMTHEELIDRSIGYQPTVDKFATRSMGAWAEFVSALASVREGAGTVLDNCLIFAHSEVSLAKNHDVSAIPVMLAGSAGGRVKTGIHVQGGGEPITRIGLTLQQVMGVKADHWGEGAMRATRPVSEILV